MVVVAVVVGGVVVTNQGVYKNFAIMITPFNRTLNNLRYGSIA